MQEFCWLSIISKIRVNRDRYASLTENPHEVSPATDALYRRRLGVIAQERLLHHVEFPRPGEHTRKLIVIKGYRLRCALRMRQIDEGHRQRDMDFIGVVGCLFQSVYKIVFDARNRRDTGAVQVIGAVSIQLQHLSDTEVIHEPDAKPVEGVP